MKKHAVAVVDGVFRPVILTAVAMGSPGTCWPRHGARRSVQRGPSQTHSFEHAGEVGASRRTPSAAASMPSRRASTCSTTGPAAANSVLEHVAEVGARSGVQRGKPSATNSSVNMWRSWCPQRCSNAGTCFAECSSSGGPNNSRRSWNMRRSWCPFAAAGATDTVVKLVPAAVFNNGTGEEQVGTCHCQPCSTTDRLQAKSSSGTCCKLVPAAVFNAGTSATRSSHRTCC